MIAQLNSRVQKRAATYLALTAFLSINILMAEIGHTEAAPNSVVSDAAGAEVTTPKPAVGESKFHEMFTNCAQLLLPSYVALDPDADNEQKSEFATKIFSAVKGQNDGVGYFVDTINVARAGIQDRNKPFARIMLTGPTGVGKTETVKAVVSAMGGNPDFNLIRVDCGELQGGHEISKLIGASASYVGYGDKPAFHQKEIDARSLTIKGPDGKDMKVIVVLIDEIEKASSTLFNLLLGILDNGVATMGDNSKSNFRNAIIVATSNLGANEVKELIALKRENLRHAPADPGDRVANDLTGRYDMDMRMRIAQAQKGALVEKYRPEFVNRWQAIIQYLHLGPEEFYQILGKELALIQKRVFSGGIYKVNVLFTENAKQYLIGAGTDFENGARELQRTLDNRVTKQLARIMMSNQVAEGDVVMADLLPDGTGLSFIKIASGLSRDQMREMADKAYPGYDMLNASFVQPTTDLNGTADGKSLIARLNDNPLVIKALMSESTKKSGLSTQSMKIDDKPAQITYVEIGKELYQLTMYSGDGVFKAEVAFQVNPKVQDKFPTNQIAAFTVEEIEKRLPKAEDAAASDEAKKAKSAGFIADINSNPNVAKKLYLGSTKNGAEKLDKMLTNSSTSTGVRAKVTYVEIDNELFKILYYVESNTFGAEAVLAIPPADAGHFPPAKLAKFTKDEVRKMIAELK